MAPGNAVRTRAAIAVRHAKTVIPAKRPVDLVAAGYRLVRMASANPYGELAAPRTIADFLIPIGFWPWCRETQLALLQRLRPVTPRPSSSRRRGSRPYPRHFRFMPWIPACAGMMIGGGARRQSQFHRGQEICIGQLLRPTRVPDVAHPFCGPSCGPYSALYPQTAVRPAGLKPPQDAKIAAIQALRPALGTKYCMNSTLEPTGSTAEGGCATLFPKSWILPSGRKPTATTRKTDRPLRGNDARRRCEAPISVPPGSGSPGHDFLGSNMGACIRQHRSSISKPNRGDAPAMPS